MINRKYQVFISSTFKNMEKARKAAIAGVSDCNHIPIALENFAPQNTSDLEVIKRAVHDCPIYILILGPTYGAIPTGREKSYTHIEYELAKAAGREVLVFALNWDDIITERQKLHPVQDREEEKNMEKLTAFWNEVQSGTQFCRQWRMDAPEEIRRFVLMALKDLPFRENPPRGLVPEAEFQQELIDSLTENEFLRDTVSAIRSFDKLYKRTSTNIEPKVRAAEFLAQRYHARMASEKTKGIFFESGSSVAFIVKSLPDSLWRNITFGREGEPNKQISTNNVLVYLMLWLNKGVPCTQFPWGLPEKTYGASFGPVGVLDSRDPNYEGKPLNTRARDAIKNLGAARLALKRKNTSLIVAAASGLQLSDGHKIIGDEGYSTPASLKSAVEKCYGPHVGSYNNKVFKRYLYETRLPVMLAVDGSKIDSPIDVRKCHFIFDEELPWPEVIANYPLAFCMGCRTEELDRLEETFREKMPGFEVITTQKTRAYSALIARNDAFKKEFPEEIGLS
ncbi:MAG: DUF4062 domain-containing protein [Chloroflexi bacterium]|nr:DUF4062 domain-containing protein [Chloroflexota bacterium]